MFNYSEFKNIINLIKVNLPIVDFSEVNEKTKSFCVIRHDIEFSVDRALRMARIEADDLGITSTYTVQLRNNTYNALSEKNIKAVREIQKLGHRIGLHQNPPNLSATKITENILKDIGVLEHYYDFKIDRFAFHRCGSNPELLEKYVKVPNKINCYAEEFFHYFKGNKPKDFRVHYVADSNHKWKYGHPLYVDYSVYPFRMQLLTHPYSWTEDGYNNMSNFNRLIKERNSELVADMSTETNTFPQELL